MIKIVLDENVPGSAAVASYLATCISAGGDKVTTVPIAATRAKRGAEISIQENDAVISLTPNYRSTGPERRVYWLGESSIGDAAEVQNLYVRFKHKFVNAMNIGSLRDCQVFVDGTQVKSRLAPNVGTVKILRFPMTYRPTVLPGAYGRAIVVEIDASAQLCDEDLRAVLEALDRPGTEGLLVYSADPMVLDRVGGLIGRTTSSLQVIREFDAFVSALSRSLLFAGIGLSDAISFQRLSLAATMLRPALLFRSSVDDDYFVDEVTGFQTDEVEALGYVAGLLSGGLLDPQMFGECLHLHYTRRYCPDRTLLEALR